jgi:hypothetical protein
MLDRGEVAAARNVVTTELQRLDYPNTANAPGLESTLRVAAKVTLRSGEASAAEQYADDSYELAAAAAREPELSANVGYSLLLRAKARLMRNRPDAAADDLELANEALRNGLGPDHPETAESRDLLQQALAERQ